MNISRIIIVMILMLASATAFAQQDSSLVKSVDSTLAETPSQEVAKEAGTPVRFSISPSLGVTFQSISRDQDESENLQWLLQLQSKFSYEGQPLQFNANLFAQYGALVTKEASPKKVQDNLQVSLVPSLTLSERLGLRLFFEVTGETEMGPGKVDSVETGFLDPLFLYETLFLGHKTHTVSEDGNTEFEFVVGVGYAFQQTVTNKFILEQNRQFVVDENNPLQHVQAQFTVESGYSGIIELGYTRKIGEDFTFRSSSKTVILTKDHFTEDVKNSRVGSLLLAGLQYKFLALDYTLHVLYDHNISPRRQLDQTMVFGLRFDL